MTEMVAAAQSLMSRWLELPGSEHPYILHADRIDEYIASQDEWLDPDIEFSMTGIGAAAPPGMRIEGRGRESWWQMWREWAETWGDYRFGLGEWEEINGWAVVDIRVSAGGGSSGVPVSLLACQALQVKDGRWSRLRQFADRETARAMIESGATAG